MTAFDRLAIIAIILAGLLFSALISLHHYGEKRYEAGYAAAIDSGKAQHDQDVVKYQKLESDIRVNDAKRDSESNQREIEHAQALADAQRRVRAGTDRLRCPASPVQPSAAPADRPASVGATTDGGGPDLVPEVATDLLGIASDVAGLVRRYDRLVERFDECRALNAK